MKKCFVCLANSYKEKGRCVAGIELDTKGNIIMEDDKPKWIRPVSAEGHGEIPSDLVSGIDLLDIIEMEVTEECPDGHQSENVFFDEESLECVGKLSKAKLNKASEDSKYIFGTRYSSLSEEVIEKLSHSLMLIEIDTFEVLEIPNEQKPKYQKIRLKFSYNGFEYDLPITDPDFLNTYRENPKILNKINSIKLCLSLGVKFTETNRYYKLIAGVIY